jgi:predicted phosphate transport protein (TIGR00153 family)
VAGQTWRSARSTLAVASGTDGGAIGAGAAPGSASSMRLPFIPREEKFFDLFVEDAQNVLAGARTLDEFFRSYDQRERIASELRDLERRGDGISHDIGHRLENTFVTPFDREDIHQLITRLDDIIDFIEEVADTCILYKIDAPTSVAQEQTQIIVQQCEQLVAALEKLKGFKDIAPHWIEVHRLENEGDRIGRQAVADLFTNGQVPIEIIKWKDVYALLENAIDACEDAANVIERIVVKHA